MYRIESPKPVPNKVGAFRGASWLVGIAASFQFLYNFIQDSGSNGLGSSPGWGTKLCSWARHFTLIVPLSTQVTVQMGTGEFTAGGNPAMD